MPTTHTTPIDLRGFHGRECEAVLNNEAEIHCKGKISVNDFSPVKSSQVNWCGVGGGHGVIV